MNDIPMDDLMARFLRLGGKINQYYLRQDKSAGRVLVNLNGWYGGKNLRDALNKALTGQKPVSTGSAGSV